ncbi:MAG: hypothetical protein E7675_05465, partial [Ruminococcaceae bacterium]|nr:hypothetical protein [Oscillospiraceae bacterium]
MKKASLFIALALIVLSFVSCNANDDPILIYTPDIPVGESTTLPYDEGIVLNTYKRDMLVGEFFNLTATVFGNGSDTKITFSSSNESVATVTASGRVVARSVGTATIVAATEHYTAECAVTVYQDSIPTPTPTPTPTTLLPTSEPTVTPTAEPTVTPDPTPTETEPFVKPEKIIINGKEGGRSYIDAGKTYKFKAKVYPENASQEVYWILGNSRVGKIDETGLLTESFVFNSNGSEICTVMAYSVVDDTVCGTYEIVVIQRPESVAINNKEELPQTLEIGETLKLKFTIFPVNTYAPKAEWSSSDESVLTVDKSTGLVTAVGGGEATVTVKTLYGAKVDSITIQVPMP